MKALRESDQENSYKVSHHGPLLKLKDGWYETQRQICPNSLGAYLPSQHGDGSVRLEWDVYIVRVEGGKQVEAKWVKDYAHDVPFSNFTPDERYLLDMYARLKTKVEAFAFPKIEEITRTKSFYGKMKPYERFRDKDRVPEKRPRVQWKIFSKGVPE